MARELTEDATVGRSVQARERALAGQTRLQALRPVPMVTLLPLAEAISLLLVLSLFRPWSTISILYGVLTLGALAATDRSRTNINPRHGRSFSALAASLTIPLFLVMPFMDSMLQWGTLARHLPIIAASLLIFRAVGWQVLRRLRLNGFDLQPTLIVGAGPLGVKLARTLQDHPEFGLEPVGFLDLFDGVGLPVPVLGEPHELETVASRLRISRVIIAFGATSEPDVVQLIRSCIELSAEVYVVPRFFELGLTTERPESRAWDIPLVRLHRRAARRVSWQAKRVLDVALASMFLLISAPIFGAVAMAVRLSDGGPVFFRQKRVGQFGRVFEMLKFRTMSVNDDSETAWCAGDDVRLTRVGRVLRRASLDEVPQLINVLKGDMSLVGPRPERPYFADRFSMEVRAYRDRERVPVGMTGWAQIHRLRGDTSIEDRAAFDNHYVEHWSLWRDLGILARTLGAVLRGEGR
jgi:exopolysaccharide biosynthesis polyprenyl glycosylphosphotransferase